MENNILMMQEFIKNRLGVKEPMPETNTKMQECPKVVQETVKSADVHPVQETYEKYKEKIQRKINKFFEFNPSLNNDEKALVESFLLNDRNIRYIDGYIKLQTLGHSFLREDFNPACKFLEGDEIFAVVCENDSEKAVVNLCIPKHSVRMSLSDWVIYEKKLQVRGYSFQKTLPLDKEITSDKEYLAKCINKMEKAGIIDKITNAIHVISQVSKVNTNLLTITPACDYIHLTTDAMEYAENLAKMKKLFICVSALPAVKDITIFSMYGKEYAAVDPYHLGAFLYLNKKGYYQLKLYIPDEEMEEYLAY